MSDPQNSDPGMHPGSPEEDGGALLFDSTAPISLDDLDDFDAGPQGGSGLTKIVIGMMVASVVAIGALVATSRDTDAANEAALAEIEALATTATPAQIVAVGTGEVDGTIGSEAVLSVRVLASGGRPFADTVVVFAVESGTAGIDNPTVRTETDGTGVTRVRLPIEPGISTVSASVPGSSIPEARLIVRALPGRARRIAIASGNGQQAPIGQLVPTRVRVTIADSAGNPVPNSEVRFEIAQGDGMTAPTRTRTDSAGVASAVWRLGIVEGPQSLVATSSEAVARVTFSATAVAAEEGGPNPNAPLPPLESSEVMVSHQAYAIGSSHVCIVTGNSVDCRGGNERGQAPPNPVTGFVAVATGGAHTCALDLEGSAHCWGANDRGQLGDGSRSDQPRPTPVRSDLRFSVVAAGESHTCGLAGGGVPLCWGQNLSGQLGDGTRNDQTVPRTVGGGLTFSALAAGWNHTCGLTSNGNAFCWGLNSKGQLGDGSTLDRLEPVLVRGAVSTIVAGSEHTCGISQGAVLCWGGNDWGQLGDDSNVARGQPVEVVGLPGPPTHLAAGAVHSCALVQGGEAFCWGQNYSGQIGDGTTQNHARATAVAGGHRFVEIHAGGAQTCGRTADGTEYCWGLNQNGQLGDGTRGNRSSPTRVGG